MVLWLGSEVLHLSPVKGVMVGKDYTIFALQDGAVRFESDKKTKFISVY